MSHRILSIIYTWHTGKQFTSTNALNVLVISFFFVGNLSAHTNRVIYKTLGCKGEVDCISYFIRWLYYIYRYGNVNVNLFVCLYKSLNC